jgi:hypothetical protein
MIKFLVASLLALVIVAPVQAGELPADAPHIIATGPAADGGKFLLTSTTHSTCEDGEYVSLYVATNGKVGDAGCWHLIPDVGTAVRWDTFGDFIYRNDLFTPTPAFDEYVAKYRKTKDGTSL